MTEVQLYLAIGVPVLSNALMFTLLALYVNAKIDGCNIRIDGIQNGLSTRIDGLRNEMNARFDAAHQALLRVEGVLDARLSKLEESRH